MIWCHQAVFAGDESLLQEQLLGHKSDLSCSDPHCTAGSFSADLKVEPEEDEDAENTNAPVGQAVPAPRRQLPVKALLEHPVLQTV